MNNIKEKKITDALDNVNNEGFEKISDIYDGYALPVEMREKIAWSVIDAADNYDEAESLRRKEFKHQLKMKKIRKIVITTSVVAIVLIALYLAHVFDSVLLPKYEYKFIEPLCKIESEKMTTDINGTLFKEVDAEEGSIPAFYLSNYKILDNTSLPDDFPSIDNKKIKNTIYDSYAYICRNNDMAQDDPHITEEVYLSDNNGFYVAVTYEGIGISYKEEDTGKTWVHKGGKSKSTKLASNTKYITSSIIIRL